MNVASLDLCKELYELSGWKGTHCYWVMDDGTPYLAYGERMNGLSLSAYDLGYLLKKLHELPFSVALNNQYNGKWNAYYQLGALIEPQEADTPEDAACKLAIELFKQGVLK